MMEQFTELEDMERQEDPVFDNKLKEFRVNYLESDDEDEGFSEQTIKNIHISVRKFFIWYKIVEQDKEYSDFIKFRYPSTHHESASEPEYTAEEICEKSRREIEEIIFAGEDRFGLIDGKKCKEYEKEHQNRATVIGYFEDKIAAEPEMDEVIVTEEDVAEIKRSDIIDFIKYYLKDEKDVCKGTARKYRNSLRHFFNEWASDPDYGDYADEMKLNSGKVSRVLKEFSSSNKDSAGKELDFKDACKLVRRKRSPKDRALLMTFLKTGIRSHELVNIQLKDVHLEEKYIHISHRKGGKWQNVCIDEECRKALNTYINGKPDDESNPEDYLFTHSSGKQYSPGSISDYVTSLAESVGIDIVGAHDFRHSFSHYYVRERGNSEEGDKKYLKKQLSHSDKTEDVTEVYTDSDQPVDEPPSEDRRQDYERAIPKYLPI